MNNHVMKALRERKSGEGGVNGAGRKGVSIILLKIKINVLKKQKDEKRGKETIEKTTAKRDTSQLDLGHNCSKRAPIKV